MSTPVHAFWRLVGGEEKEKEEEEEEEVQQQQQHVSCPHSSCNKQHLVQLPVQRSVVALLGCESGKRREGQG